MLEPSSLTPQQKLARAFLGLLAGSNPYSRVFNFRTFDDTDGKRRELTGKFSGRIEDCTPSLQVRNMQGAGAFVVVNEGGHTDAEITKVRAVFADTDGAPLEPILRALTPHFVIESSPGKWHVYWLVAEGFPLDRFKPVQKAIAAKFGTDPKVSNLSRVMRVPGFNHCKGQPFNVHFMLEHLKPKLPRYSVDQIMDGLGLHAHLPTQASPSTTLSGQQAPYARQHSIAEIEAMLRFIDPWSDRDRWMDVLFAIADQCGEAGRELVIRWSRGELWQGAVNT